MTLPKDMAASETPRNYNLVRRASRDMMAIDSLPVGEKGWISVFNLLLIVMLIYLLIEVLPPGVMYFGKAFENGDWLDKVLSIFDVLFSLLLAAIMVGAVVWGVRVDILGPKEIPIVFNRAPVFNDSSSLSLTISGKSKTGDLTLYRAIYESKTTTESVLEVAPEMENHRVTLSTEGTRLTVTGEFVVEQMENIGRVPRGPGHSWPRTGNFEEIVVSVVYQPDMKIWPDFDVVGRV